MSVIGIFSFPIPSSTNTSPSAPLVSHLSHVFPAQSHKPYHVDHRLFVDTSSLLPAPSASASQPTAGGTPAVPSATRLRQFTQFLTTSHASQSTYVGTTDPSGTSDLTLITIPSNNQESFVQLINTKLQAQWAQRQAIVLDGVSVSLPPRNDGDWSLRIGDLRNTGPVGGRSAAGSASGAVRAVLVEVEYHDASEKNPTSENESDVEEKTAKKYEDLFRGMLKRLFHHVPEFKFEDARLVVKVITESTLEHETSTGLNSKPVGWELASIYMEVLRGNRS